MRTCRRLPARAPLLAALALSAAACADSQGRRDPESAAAAVASQLLPGEASAQAPLPPARPAPPPRPRDAAPPIIRGVYVNSGAAGSPPRLRELLALADSTEINAFVVDVKTEDGVHYPSAVPKARESSHAPSVTVRDLRALVDTLQAHGVWPIARIVVFKDPRLALRNPAWTIRTPAGAAWRDKQRLMWISPWDPAVWDHNLAIAEEAVAAGFREIQFDYVRFPEAYASLPRQVHPAAPEGGRRVDAIEAFLRRARERLHPLGATITADLFGLSPNDAADVGVGHQWERMSAVADHVLPMVYPSHYFSTHLPGIRRPNRMPYETVFTSVGMGVVRSRRLAQAGVEPARIVPWIQGFTATWNDRGYPYGPQQARDQMRAVYDLGLEDWIFWHPGSNYAQLAGAFARTTESRAQRFDPSASLVRHVDVLDRGGAAAARERVAKKE